MLLDIEKVNLLLLIQDYIQSNINFQSLSCCEAISKQQQRKKYYNNLLLLQLLQITLIVFHCCYQLLLLIFLQHLHELLNLDISALEYMMNSFPEIKEKEEMRKIIGRFGLTGRQQVTYFYYSFNVLNIIYAYFLC